MLSKIKFHLRRLRSQGKYKTLINFLSKLNYNYKHLKQWKSRHKALASLNELDYQNNSADWTKYIFHTVNGFFKPIQNPWEITELTKIVAELRPEKILEIGTANGGTLFLMARASSPHSTIISLDLPGGINGGGYPNWKIPLYEKFASSKQRLHLLRANSHLESSKTQVSELIHHGKLDFIMIDGDHSYEGVKADFELYKPLVRKGGVIALHDILYNRFDPEVNVDRFWNEIKTDYNTREIVHDPKQGNLGIGIVYL